MFFEAKSGSADEVGFLKSYKLVRENFAFLRGSNCQDLPRLCSQFSAKTISMLRTKRGDVRYKRTNSQQVAGVNRAAAVNVELCSGAVNWLIDIRPDCEQVCGVNAAIAVGGTVALLGLFASPISGASMNPARTLGPGIVGANLTGWWVYVFGDLIGAAIAVMIITLVRGLPNDQELEAAEGSALPLIRGAAKKQGSSTS